MLDIKPQDLKIITDILKKFVPNYEIRVFGSRFKNNAKKHSDLDLAIVGPTKLNFNLIYDLKEAFQESNLPYRVDVLDWHSISPEFQTVIEEGYEVLLL